MTWTVACFCGNVYTAPPDRCEVCGSTFDGGALEDPASAGAQNGADPYGLVARCDPLPVPGHRRSQHGTPDARPGR